jgi:transcriptional regulator with XRE-family HTH domain
MGVGKQLRQARETRGLTVRDIAELTKISPRQIDAIETERYEKLPGGIFGRGYVRALASTLKLDPDACVKAYRDETEPEVPSVPAESGPQASAGDSTARRPTAHFATNWRAEASEPRLRLAVADEDVRKAAPGVIAAVLLGLCAILLILWLGRDREPAPASRLSTATGVTAVKGARDGIGDPPVGTSGRKGSPPPATAGTEIRLEAVRPCWVTLTVDDERVAFRMLRAGELVRATMHTSASLHTGDAGALKLSVGGSEAKPVGPSGEVKTLELAPAAVRNP